MKRFLNAIRAVLADDVPGGHRQQDRETGRRVVRHLLLCLAVLLIGFAIYLAVHGNYISLYYRTGYEIVEDGEHGYTHEMIVLTEDDLGITFEPEGIASLRGMSVNNGVVRCDIGKTGQGEVTCSIKIGESIYTEYLTAGRLFIYRPGRLVFPCWEGLMAAGFLFCCCAFILLFREYRKLSGEKLFSYTAIYLLGLAVFAAVLAVGSGILLGMLAVDPTAYDFGKIIEWGQNVMMYFSLLTGPGIFLFAAALCISNIKLIRKEGFRSVNLLGIILSALLVIGMTGGLILFEILSRVVSYDVSSCFMSVYYSIYCFMICLLIGVFLIFNRVRKHVPSYDKGYIIILGCKIKDDGTLYPLIRGRVDRALNFAEEQEKAGGPSPIFIPSGGKGDDEPLSEADAMAEYLVSKGIPRERIFPENRSVRTRENMRFSKEIADQQCPGEEGAFSTTNYHVFRSGVIASGEGLDIDGMGAPTKWYFWPNALIREFIGLIVDDVRKVVSAMLFIAVISGMLNLVF